MLKSAQQQKRGNPDRITHVFGFEEFVDHRVRKGGIAAEIEALHPAPVAGHNRFQHRAPALGAVQVARTI